MGAAALTDDTMRKSICFVSLYSYSLFKEGATHVFGGGSGVRAWLFGNGLSELPYNDVSFIVFDHGQPKSECFKKITVYRHSHYKGPDMFGERLVGEMAGSVRKSKKFPFLKIVAEKISAHLLWKIFLYLAVYFKDWSLKLIWSLIRRSLYMGNYEIEYRKIRIYRKLNADIYCAVGVSKLTAEIAVFCRQYGKKFVLFSGSDMDFSGDYHAGSQEINIYGNIGNVCYYVIENADLIITQTAAQSRLLMERFGKNSVTIVNPIDLDKHAHDGFEPFIGKYALWIGRSDEIKQPEIFLKLAGIVKDIKFVMIVNQYDPRRHKKIIEMKSDNVKIIEYIPIAEIEKLFVNAFVFINTSILEGFPNAFLQAGKYGVPVLSLNVDPDNFISNNRCGIVAEGSFEKLVEGLQFILENPDKREEFSKNIKDYVYKNHDLKGSVKMLDYVLRTL